MDVNLTIDFTSAQYRCYCGEHYESDKEICKINVNDCDVTYVYWFRLSPMHYCRSFLSVNGIHYRGLRYRTTYSKNLWDKCEFRRNCLIFKHALSVEFASLLLTYQSYKNVQLGIDCLFWDVVVL